MGRYEITHRDGSKTVVVRRHPFLNFLLIAFGVLLVFGSILTHWWLIFPTVAVLAVGVYAKKTADKKR